VSAKLPPPLSGDSSSADGRAASQFGVHESYVFSQRSNCTQRRACLPLFFAGRKQNLVWPRGVILPLQTFDRVCPAYIKRSLIHGFEFGNGELIIISCSRRSASRDQIVQCCRHQVILSYHSYLSTSVQWPLKIIICILRPKCPIISFPLLLYIFYTLGIWGHCTQSHIYYKRPYIILIIIRAIIVIILCYCRSQNSLMADY